MSGDASSKIGGRPRFQRKTAQSSAEKIFENYTQVMAQQLRSG
jgi:hypothetical protein